MPFSLGLCFCYYVPRWRTGFFVVVFTNPVAADVFVWLAEFALIPATLLQAVFCVVVGGGPDFSIVVRSALVSPLRGEPIRTGLGLDPWGHRLGSYRGRPGGRCPDTGLQVTPRTHSWSDGVADLLVHVAILHFLCVSVDVVWV